MIDELVRHSKQSNDREVYQDGLLLRHPSRIRGGQVLWGMTTYYQVKKEEMESSRVYRLDKQWPTQEEVVVEIRWGRVLWVVGQGDETVKVKLPRSDRVKVSAATAFTSNDGMLAIVVPKRGRPRKGYKYKYSGLIRVKTVHIPISN
ncbi:hypothetical protein NL676_029029 [Syzygium grande]|nr:hypothetical protein NL676_029029 [Syzygium grande]